MNSKKVTMIFLSAMIVFSMILLSCGSVFATGTSPVSLSSSSNNPTTTTTTGTTGTTTPQTTISSNNNNNNTVKPTNNSVTNYGNNTIKDNNTITKDKTLPKTGASNIVSTLLVGGIVLAVVLKVKADKYKDIK